MIKLYINILLHNIYRYKYIGNMDGYNNMKWQCKKCNAMIDNCIDMDYHNDTMHPNFSDKYVFTWYKYGKKGLSPYD